MRVYSVKFKLSVFSLFMVIVFACIGTGYSLCQGGFQINNNDSHVGIRVVEVGDIGPDPNFPPGYNPQGKDVSSTNAENGEFKCFVGTVEFYNEISIALNNVYPWYASNITIQFGNCDPFPGYITSIDLQIIDGSAVVLEFIVVDGWRITNYKSDGTIEVITGNTQEELELAIQQLVLDPDQFMEVYISFHCEQEVIIEGTPQEMPMGQGVSYRYIISWSQVI